MYQAPQQSQRLHVLCQRPSVPAGWVASSKPRFGPVPGHFGFLQLLRPRFYQWTARELLTSLSPGFPWQSLRCTVPFITFITVPFIHDAATEKQLELVPPRRVSPPESLVRGQTRSFLNNKMGKKGRAFAVPPWKRWRKPQGHVLPSHTRGLLEPAVPRLIYRRCETKRGLHSVRLGRMGSN